jgi:hypothetical protein
MFDTKQSSLIATTTSFNQFIKEGLKASSEILSENGALKYSTSGNEFVDNFAAIARFKEPRSFAEISTDMEKLWSIDPKNTVKLAIYIRMITRKSQITVGKFEVKSTQEVQRGQGLKHEGIMRMMWLAIYHPLTFKANIPLFIAAGSWKDIIIMMNLDLQYNGWKDKKLDWKFLETVLKAGLINPNTEELVKKYLPTIRTSSKCITLESQADTLIGRWFAKKLNPDLEKASAYKQYRLIKSNGKAHQWQQLISKQLYNQIDFNKVAGRALMLLVGSKFLENHNLIEKYTEWIKSKPVAKYTGFVFELFEPFGLNYHIKSIPEYQKITIEAQFNQLVQTGKTNTTSKLLVVRDISGSMTCQANGCKMSAYSIAKAMALYFSKLLDGPFKDAYAVFSDECELKTWKGETIYDQWKNDTNSDYGSTNFLSIADLLINIKKKGVSESEFPNGVLALSDGEFNNSYDYTRDVNVSNFKLFRLKLREAGFSNEYVDNFKLILWDIPNSYYGKTQIKFEDFADAPNSFYISGYDPSAISFILGNEEFKASPKNNIELFEAAMDQELLNLVTIVKEKKYNKKIKK